MKDKIEQMRSLLDDLEAQAKDEQGLQFSQHYSALELPSLVSAIVEFLHPLLTPYEIAIYWYLFERSIVRSGEQYARASTRGMSEVAQSASGQSSAISYGAIKKTLDSLQEKGAISIAGDTTREGTLYKVSIPDEIPLCKDRMATAASSEGVVPLDLEKEIDYYNIAENRTKVFERDGYMCHYCKKQLTRFSATLDHIQPVSRGGDNSIGNLITACLHCNSERGNRPVSDFLIEDDA